MRRFPIFRSGLPDPVGRVAGSGGVAFRGVTFSNSERKAVRDDYRDLIPILQL